jgi:hypothetical protein
MGGRWLTYVVTSSSRPADVLAAAGDWLGAALAPRLFVWMPGSKRLQRRVGTLVHQVHLQPYRWNREGQAIAVGTRLNVREPALRRWRNANLDRVRTPVDDFVCGHLLGYASGRANGDVYGEAADGDINLTDPAERGPRLQAFVAMFREAVLPWFDEASDPDLIVTSRAGDCTNDPVALTEWLASRNRLDLVSLYAHRRLSRAPGTQSSYGRGVSKARSEVPFIDLNGSHAAELLGWSVTRLTENPRRSV